MLQVGKVVLFTQVCCIIWQKIQLRWLRPQWSNHQRRNFFSASLRGNTFILLRKICKKQGHKFRTLKLSSVQSYILLSYKSNNLDPKVTLEKNFSLFESSVVLKLSSDICHQDIKSVRLCSKLLKVRVELHCKRILILTARQLMLHLS